MSKMVVGMRDNQSEIMTMTANNNRGKIYSLTLVTMKLRSSCP